MAPAIGYSRNGLGRSTRPWLLFSTRMRFRATLRVRARPKASEPGIHNPHREYRLRAAPSDASGNDKNESVQPPSGQQFTRTARIDGRIGRNRPDAGGIMIIVLIRHRARIFQNAAAGAREGGRGEFWSA